MCKEQVSGILLRRKRGDGMEIAYLRIQNFKSIRDMEIPEIDQALILVGKNNTGKTSVLDAIGAVCGGYRIGPQDFNERGQAVRIQVGLKMSREDLELFHRLGRVSRYRRYEAWYKAFCQKLPDFKDGVLTFTYHANRDGKVRYEDSCRKHNPWILQVLPRIYRINAERELAQLQNDLLMFQEDEQLQKLRSGRCIFEQAKRSEEHTSELQSR